MFGPNNFPFAFNSIAGGDFVAAVAAGNPVIGKANTGHPGTTRLLAELALPAAQQCGLPSGFIQLLYRTPPDGGFRLVSHPKTAATGFTGSKSAGLQLKAAADATGTPIYLEMSSVNPVFILPGALEERSAAIARELFDSCALGAGQFCTRPGITIVPADGAEDFLDELTGLFEKSPAGTLLAESGIQGIAQALNVLCDHGARACDWRTGRRGWAVQFCEYAAPHDRRGLSEAPPCDADGSLRDRQHRRRRRRSPANDRDRRGIGREFDGLPLQRREWH